MNKVLTICPLVQTILNLTPLATTRNTRPVICICDRDIAGIWTGGFWRHQMWMFLDTSLVKLGIEIMFDQLRARSVAET